MSLKNEKLSPQDSKLQPLAVPEWNTTVYIRVMSGTERDQWEADIFKDGKLDKTQLRARLLVKTLADENGVRIFTDQDTAALGAKSGNVLMKLFDKAQKMNAL